MKLAHAGRFNNINLNRFRLRRLHIAAHLPARLHAPGLIFIESFSIDVKCSDNEYCKNSRQVLDFRTGTTGTLLRNPARRNAADSEWMCHARMESTH